MLVRPIVRPVVGALVRRVTELGYGAANAFSAAILPFGAIPAAAKKLLHPFTNFDRLAI